MQGCFSYTNRNNLDPYQKTRTPLLSNQPSAYTGVFWYVGLDRMSGESGVYGFVEPEESKLLSDAGFHRADSKDLRRITLSNFAVLP